MCRIFNSLQSALTSDFNTKKVCTKCAQCLQQVCMVCTCSAQILHINDMFSWEKHVVDKNADIMHTFCRHMQIYCRHDADYYISVQLEHFFVVISKCTQDGYCRLYAHFYRLVQTLCRHYPDNLMCVTGASFCCYQWQRFSLCFDFCRTYVASEGRIRAGCFSALRRV